MRYRIQTDGEKYRVQERTWWTLGLWIVADRHDDYIITGDYVSHHKKSQAQDWIDRSPDRKQKWTTV